MSAAPATTAPAPARKAPTWLSMTLDRVVVEMKDFIRSREQMVFIFAFPLMLMVIFGSIFGGQEIAPNVTFSQYFLAGMIASGILNTGFQSLGISIAIDRDEDVLKRINATPLPPSAMFVSKTVQVLMVSIVQITLLVILGALLYDIDVPTEPSKWLTFAWVFVLGTAASTTLGIATSSLLRNGKSASAILTPVVLILQFSSGVFFVFTQLPTAFQTFAEIFPLKWLAQGMRSVFLPDYFAAEEARGAWEHQTTAIMLAAWAIVGLVVSIYTFRWLRSEDR